ncbi:MAG: hypothetical protein ACXW27_09035 [Allosphingosinicella sp.]
MPAGFLSYDDVEARLIEAVRSWWRMPGGGAWPFASDGPWHLIRKTWEDWDARDPKPLRHLPLRRAEIGEMQEATEWLLIVAGEAQRRTLVAGLIDRAKGRARPGWKALREALGEPGLRSAAAGMRYSRAIRAICEELNRRAGL